MASPKHGKPEVDMEANELLKKLKHWTDQKRLMNLSHKLLKELSRAAKHFVAEVENEEKTVLQKKIGGHKGGTCGSD